MEPHESSEMADHENDDYDPMIDGITVARARSLGLPGCRPGVLHWHGLEQWLEGRPAVDKRRVALWRPTTQRWFSVDDAAFDDRAIAIEQRTDQAEIMDSYMDHGIDLPDDVCGRKKAYVKKLFALVFDFDEGVDLEKAKHLGTGERADGTPWQLFSFGHTSFSHTPEAPKARVVFPLLRPVGASQWGALWAAGERWAISNGLTPDDKTKDSGRFYFDPCFHTDRKNQYESWINWGMIDEEGGPYLAPEGSELSPKAGYPLLDPAWLLDRHGPPAIPVSQRQAAPSYAPARNRPGVRGQWSAADSAKRLAESWLQARSTKVRSQPKGHRSNYAYGAGRFLGNTVYMGILDDTSINWWMNELTQSAMVTGLSEREARRQVQSGFDDGVKEPSMELENAIR
jgi:hypothetical protein